MEPVTIQNVRPIGLLEFLPMARGVQIIRGPNESGKSKALEAVGALLGRKAELEPDPGVLMPSFVSGFGARLTISRRKTPSGELQVDALEGLNPFLLADPGIEKPDRADAARFEIICAAVGAKPELPEFKAVLGVDPEPYMSGKTRDRLAASLPEFTASLRSDLMEKARSFESSARAHSERSNALREGLEPEAEAGGKPATFWSEQRGALGARKANLEGAIERRRAELEEFRALQGELKGTAVQGESINLAREAIARDDKRTDELAATVARLQEQLVEAANEKKLCESHRDGQARLLKELLAASDARGNAEARVAELAQKGGDLKGMGEQLNSTLVSIEAADAGYRAAVLNENRAKKLAAADDEWAQANADQKDAIRLRTMSDACESVLSRAAARACQKHSLVARDGRLIVARPTGDVYYHVLSGGARNTIAVDLFVDALKSSGKPAVLVVPQEAWMELDQKHQAETDEYAYTNNVLILTGAPDDGPLRVEPFKDRSPARAPAEG